ncbi:DNA primase [Pseudodesulfovibrio piezophilus]|uniref:DNA primase n=1 Tax=Pseudodesulfovibrio piezophilus (strain DSM 21447 / JCM 15486 / C1TLV30) TaxID=1322246 RepID=M1WNS7_PSEP2|nr:DNA primase [Pseudodesulfovibrio piezophilus]CCH47759.1 DNA primase [Pseudodesulfovibrio piezophilus C1TLV30]
MDRSAVEAIKAKLSIADIVRRYVDLKPVSGRWMGACPFHQETKPSMSVNDEEGFFYCFGCQASGDVIDFYSRINGLDFRQSLEQLAGEAGIELSHVPHDPHVAERKARKKRLYDMHEESKKYFQRNLSISTGDIARRYLRNRGLTQEIIEKFCLGFSPADWHGLDNYIQSKGWTSEQGVEGGLLSKNDKGKIYDRFRGRLIFPIQDLSGKVIAFGGRIITDGEPKYLNSSDTPIYKKGDHLYGLSLARSTMTRTKRAILTEGYMDVISLHQFGYTDSCGVLGTALTSEQVKKLAGFCSRIDLIFDGDGAGRKAALKSSRMILLQGVACKVVLMPEGEDVDSLLQTKGVEGLEVCMNDAPAGLQFCMNTLRTEFAPREIIAWAKSFLAELSDNSLKAYYLPRIADGLGLAEADFRRDTGISSPAKRTLPRTEQSSHHQSDPIQPFFQQGKEDKDDSYFLKFPIQYPDYIPALVEKGFERILCTDWAKALWEKLVNVQHGHILGLLNNQEKSFYIKSREEVHESILSGRELLDEWEHICNKIAIGQNKHTRRQLKEALHQAQLSGDRQRINECFRALEESLRRDDEQH